MIRTSISHPLQIAEVRAAPGYGRIGITFCPGKTQPRALSGAWKRDLGIDLNAIRDWNASAVVTLMEQHEFERLGVGQLGDEVRRRHMDWYHLPITDVSVPGPAFERAWGTAGAELRSRLRHGFDVVVHCKGGLGRSGLLAARLLAELGVPPAEAIRQVRAVRPGAIETAGQERHVMAIAAQDVPLPEASEAAIRSRAVGALVGLAVGDALGTTLEFTARDSRLPITDMIGGGPFRVAAGEWTDDTSMALALADSLYDRDGLDEEDLMRRFARWRNEGEYSHNGRCFDIGNTVSAALLRFEFHGDPIAGSTAPHTAGNGSLMRLAPVAVRFWNDRDRLKDAAARQSRTTHAAPEAVDACVAYALMIAEAIAGRPLDDILQQPREKFSGAVGAIVAGSWQGKPRDQVRSSGYALHSLEAALWSVARSGGDYRRTVLAAANLGEDADTTAAIAGQLAGAASGVDGIPQDWRARLAWNNRIHAMANALFDRSLETVR